MERKKLNILCLHGFRQNKEAFRQKLGSLRKMLKSYADFDFIEAPHTTIPLKPESNDGDERSWWFTGPNKEYVSKFPSDISDGFDESVEFVKNHIRKYGPYDGIFGFSQGATFTAILCHLCCDNELPCKFRFAILVAGFRSLCSQHSKFYEAVIDIPSLHVIGDTDGVISKERSELLLSSFKNPEVLKHSGGHYVPATKEVKESYVTFLEKYIER